MPAREDRVRCRKMESYSKGNDHIDGVTWICLRMQPHAIMLAALSLTTGKVEDCCVCWPKAKNGH